MKQRMEGRKMVRMKSLSSTKSVGTTAAEDWVTMGVLVDKLPPKYVHA